MEELRPGLWTWTSPHPDWTPEAGGPDGWEQDVRSYAYDAGRCFVLIDPLSPPSLFNELAEAKDVVVLITIGCHERSSGELAQELGAAVHAPKASVEHMAATAHPYEFGETLPGGVEAKSTPDADAAALWIPAHHALVFGDTILGDGEGGVRVPDAWLGESTTPAAFREGLRPLLELPVELVLPTHGDPVVNDAHSALERALAT